MGLLGSWDGTRRLVTGVGRRRFKRGAVVLGCKLDEEGGMRQLGSLDVR